MYYNDRLYYEMSRRYQMVPEKCLYFLLLVLVLGITARLSLLCERYNEVLRRKVNVIETEIIIVNMIVVASNTD